MYNVVAQVQFVTKYNSRFLSLFVPRSSLQEWLDVFRMNLPRPPALALPPLPLPVIKGQPELVECEAIPPSASAVQSKALAHAAPAVIPHAAMAPPPDVRAPPVPAAWNSTRSASQSAFPAQAVAPTQAQGRANRYPTQALVPLSTSYPALSVLPRSESFDISQSSAMRQPQAPAPYRRPVSTAQIDYEPIAFNNGLTHTLSEDEGVRRSSMISRRWKSEMALAVAEDDYYDDVEIGVPIINDDRSDAAAAFRTSSIPKTVRDRPLPTLPQPSPKRVPPAGSELPDTTGQYQGDDMSSEPYEFMIANEVPGQAMVQANTSAPVAKVRTRVAAAPRGISQGHRSRAVSSPSLSPGSGGGSDRQSTLERYADEVEAFMEAEELAVQEKEPEDEEAGQIYDRVTKMGRSLLIPATKQQLRSSITPFKGQEQPPPLPAKPKPESSPKQTPRYAQVDLVKKHANAPPEIHAQRAPPGKSHSASGQSQRSRQRVTFADEQPNHRGNLSDLELRETSPVLPPKDGILRRYSPTGRSTPDQQSPPLQARQQPQQSATHQQQQQILLQQQQRQQQQQQSSRSGSMQARATPQQSGHSNTLPDGYPASCTGEQLRKEMQRAANDLSAAGYNRQPQAANARRRAVSTSQLGEPRVWSGTDTTTRLGPRSAADGASSSETNIAQQGAINQKYQWEETPRQQQQQQPQMKKKIMTRAINKTRVVSSETSRKSGQLHTVSVI